LLKEGLAVPLLFDRNLWKEKSLVIAVLHQKTVLPYFDLAKIRNSPQGRQHRDFIVQLAQFRL
jgi:hypothetical protein